MAKKIKKFLKKAAPLIAAGLGAAAIGRNRRNKAIDTGIAAAEADKGSDMLQSPKTFIQKKTRPFPNFDMFDDPNFAAAEGGRAMKSKGGRVTGAAKRGFGRALMKGKK